MLSVMSLLGRGSLLPGLQQFAFAAYCIKSRSVKYLDSVHNRNVCKDLCTSVAQRRKFFVVFVLGETYFTRFLWMDPERLLK